MAKSISDKTTSRGRPKTTGVDQLIGLRLHADQIKALDIWIAKQKTPLPRPAAIRVILGMKLRGVGIPKDTAQGDARVSAMAGHEIDRSSDVSASVEQQAARKRRLLKGPGEFRDLRVDRSRGKR